MCIKEPEAFGGDPNKYGNAVVVETLTTVEHPKTNQICVNETKIGKHCQKPQGQPRLSMPLAVYKISM